MTFLPLPCLDLPESPKLTAKQDHATSRHGSPLSHPSCRRSAQAEDSRTSNFLHQKSKIQNLKFSESAFSLTEVVIAMGVAAVAFTSIIALFPLGLNMSKESYEDTQAALLAQTIFADCRDILTGDSDTYSATKGFLIQVSSNNSPTNYTANTPRNYTNILTPPTTTPTTTYIAYNQKSQSDTPHGEIMLRPFIGSSSAADFYTSGTNSAVAIAKITIRYCFPGLQNGALTTGPCQIDIAIETPGNLPTEKRKQLLFTGGVN